MGTCPKCGQKVRSRSVGDLFSLGDMLTNFRPDYGHKCPKPEEPTEPLDQDVPTDLLAAAVAFVDAMSTAVGNNGS